MGVTAIGMIFSVPRQTYEAFLHLTAFFLDTVWNEMFVGENQLRDCEYMLGIKSDIEYLSLLITADNRDTCIQIISHPLSSIIHLCFS